MKKIVLLFAFLFIKNIVFSQCDFDRITENDLNRVDSTSSGSPSIAVDKNGVLYLAFTDSGDSSKIAVKKYIGGQWINVGNLSVLQHPAQSVSLAIDTNNIVHVAYVDVVTQKVNVKKFSGFSWVSVGLPDFSTTVSTLAPIVIGKNNIPYVAFSSVIGNVEVMKFEAGAWSAVGTTGASGYAWSLAVSDSGVPYLFNQNGPYVLKFNGVSWVSVGIFYNSATSMPLGRGKTIVIDKNETPYVIFKNINLEIMKFDGTNWVSQVTTFTPSQGFGYSLALDSSGVPFMMYSNLQKLHVVNINGYGSAHNYVDYKNGSNTSSFFITPNNEKFLVYVSKLNQSKATVFKEKLSSSGIQYWQPLGITGFSRGASIAVGADSSIYMAYLDLLHSRNYTISKYHGNEWENIYISSFTTLGINNYIDIAVDNNNMAYVAYSDSINGGRLTVRDALGNAAGQVGFSSSTAKYISIAIHTNGVPYVSFTDDGCLGQARVMSLGSYWQSVGSSGCFSAGATRYNKMVLDKTGNPYVVYSDLANSGKATVMRFDGTNWLNVGLPAFSDGLVSYTSIVLDTANNIPYVIYKDHFNGSKATVMKYDGTSWLPVGSVGFSSDSVNYTDITINRYGNLQVAFSNEGLSGKAQVYTFDGVSWIIEGSYTSSPVPAKNTSIFSDKFGKTYLSFDNIEPFVYVINSAGAVLSSAGSVINSVQICSGTSIYLNGEGGNTYNWTGPNNFTSTLQSPIISNPSALNTGNYSVSISSGTCVVSDIVNVSIDTTCADIWPGDANSDGIVDNLDVLELGLHYSQTGPSRLIAGAIDFLPYFANNWTGTITNGKNLNHSDCNGDGAINDNDTLAIYYNYGLTHAFKPSQTNLLNPQLSIVPDQLAVLKGTWGTASIYAGDVTNPITNINGLAFTLDFSSALIEVDSIYIEYQNSFLDAGQNLRFRKLDFANSKVFTATTHTNNINVSGNGKIATLHYQIKSSLSTDEILNIGITQAAQSNASGAIVPLTSGTSTLMAVGASVGVQELNGNVISVSPNPTSGSLTIRSKTELQKIEVVSITGQVLLSETSSNVSHTLHLENFSNGIYFVNVYQNDRIVKREKVVLNK